MDPYGHQAEWLARVCNVEVSTARRWKRAGRVPPRYAPLLILAAGGDLGAICPAWRGWRLAAQELHSPEGDRYQPGTIRALRWIRERAAELDNLRRRDADQAQRALGRRELVIRVRIDAGEFGHEESPIEAVAELESIEPAA